MRSQTHYRINQWGFRGPDLDPRMPAHRIMVYGDSNVEAQFSNDGQTFAVQLHRELAGRFGLDYQVINAGVVGYGPDQVALRLEDELDVWHPDLIIDVIFADNDYGDLIRNGLYQIGPDGALSRYDRGQFRRWLGDHLKNFMIGHAIFKIDRLLQPLAFRYPDPAALKAMPIDQKINAHLAVLNLEYRGYQQGQPVSWGRDHYDFDVALFPEFRIQQAETRFNGRGSGRNRQGGGAAWQPPVVVSNSAIGLRCFN